MSSLVGQQWGNYRLVRLLGQGGFAEVYLAEHVHLGMQAAVKILHTVLSPADIEGFQQEARVIASLTHPHIVRLRDFNLQDGKPFLVLEYAANGTLAQKHPQGSKVSLARVVSYVAQVAQAIQYAHDRKLVHRDIKPGNMLIGSNGEILLSDFGIVTVAHATSSMQTTSSIGTLAYMAPEQIQGHPRAASDQYALAIVVYQWLTGVVPFRGSSVEIISQQLMKAPQPLCELEPLLPKSVEAVVLRALSKDPKMRFGSVSEFAQALQEAQTHAGAAFEKRSWPEAMIADASSENSIMLQRASQDDTDITAKTPVARPAQKAPGSQMPDTPLPRAEEITRTQLAEPRKPAFTPPPPPSQFVAPIEQPPSSHKIWPRVLLLTMLAVMLIGGSGLGVLYAVVQNQPKQPTASPQQGGNIRTTRTARSVSDSTATTSPTASVTTTVTAQPTLTVTQAPAPAPAAPTTSAPTATAAPTLSIVECPGPGGYQSAGNTCNVYSLYGYQPYQPADCVCTTSRVTAFGNTGTATVAYKVTSQVVTASNPNWVTPARWSGTLAAGATLSLDWDLSTGSVGAGTYTTYFTVTFSYNQTVFQTFSYKFALTAYTP